MTNEELEAALKETQEALLKVCECCGKMRGVLVAKGILDELDSSYIKLQIDEEEYIKRCKEQNKLSNLYGQIFSQMFQTDAFTEDKKKE